MFNNPVNNNTSLVKYIASNPQYKDLKPDALLLQMLNDGAITKEEYNKIKSGDTFKFTFEDTNFDDINGLWGAKFANKTNAAPKNYVEKIKNYHPLFADLEVDNNGKISPEQFDYENIKANFDEKKYIIQKNDENKSVLVIDKKTGYPVSIYSKNDFIDFLVYQKYGENGKLQQSVTVEPNGKIFSTNEYTSDGVVKFKNFHDGNPYKISRIVETAPDGTRKTVSYDKNGKIKFKDIWKKDGNMAERVELYTDGKPYKIIDNKSNTIENILCNDLIKDIGQPNKAGFFTKSSPSLNDNILKRITFENVLEILDLYKEQTGVDMMSAINKNMAINSKDKEKLVQHLEKLYIERESGDKAGAFLGDLLFKDINGLGSGKLKEHIQLVDKNNLKYVLKTYADKSENKYIETEDKLTDVLGYLTYSIAEKMEKKLLNTFAPLEGLLNAINAETGLSKKEREDMTSKIIAVSLEHLSDDVKDEIKEDISKHPENYKKIQVDILRALNKTSGDTRNPNKKSEISVPNGKFDSTIKQGATGDCWLLAALDSIIEKPQGKKQIESLIKYDPETGDAIVNLKGVKKQYKITAKEIQASAQLSTGDGDARIIELAMDKLIKEESYNSSRNTFEIDEDFGFINDVDINGNWPRVLYYTLFGVDNYDYSYSEKIDPLKEDFNNPQMAYSFGGVNEEASCSVFAKDSKNKNVSILQRHAYAIKGSDEKNIYVVNPWDSSETLTITRKDFEKLKPRIDSCKIPSE